MNEAIPIIHRRNRIEQLKGLPFGCWVEIDVEIHEGTAWLTHDPLLVPPLQAEIPPHKLSDYIPAALAQGVAGFVVDCKRENAEKFVQPIFAKHKVADYFYLNEMEVQSDIFQSQDPQHVSGIRIWKYRGADDAIHLAEDMKAVGQTAPQWIWVDCWQRGLINDITRAHLPITGEQAQKLHTLGVKLCICSPELYVHKYDTAYDSATLTRYYQGVIDYRRTLENAGVRGDAFCSKFPSLWQIDLKTLQTARGGLGSFDFGAYNSMTTAELIRSAPHQANA